MNIIVLTLLMSNLSSFAEGEDCAQKILEAEGSVFAKSFRDSYESTEKGKLITKNEALSIAKKFIEVEDVFWGAASVGSFWVVRFSPCNAMIRGGAGTMLVSSQSKSVVHTKWER